MENRASDLKNVAIPGLATGKDEVGKAPSILDDGATK